MRPLLAREDICPNIERPAIDPFWVDEQIQKLKKNRDLNGRTGSSAKGYSSGLIAGALLCTLNSALATRVVSCTS